MKFISLNDRSKLKFSKTIEFKFRHPVSEFLFDNKYLIQISKIDTDVNLNLKTAVSENYSEASEQLNVGYALDHGGFFKFEYNNTQRPGVSKVFLTLYGLKTRCLNKTDSSAYYFSNLKNMSVSYNENTIQDMLVSTTAPNIPAEILFYKKKSNLYLIIATVDNAATKLDESFLYNLVYR